MRVTHYEPESHPVFGIGGYSGDTLQEMGNPMSIQPLANLIGTVLADKSPDLPAYLHDFNSLISLDPKSNQPSSFGGESGNVAKKWDECWGGG